MKNLILVTGQPGIGKTTLIKKLINYLSQKEISFDGFYTEEVRSGNSRIGFDIVNLEGKRGILARKKIGNELGRPIVGQYAVFLNDLEQLVLPILHKVDNKFGTNLCDKPSKLMIIDEIGKMELLSKKFEETVRKLTSETSIQIIATVPLRTVPGLIEDLKKSPNSRLITVTLTNRNNVLEELITLLNV